APFVFSLVGAPLSMRSARSGRFFGAAVSLALSFLYFVFTSVSRSLGINGVLPALAAAWLPTALFLGAGAFLLQRADAPFASRAGGRAWRTRAVPSGQ